MDLLTIELEPRHYPGDWLVVRLQVNGEDLNLIVSRVEREHGYKPYVPYDWLGVEGIRSARARLSGQAQDDWPGDGRTLLLVCGECREEGCWPLSAQITIGERTVTWDKFANPEFPDRDFSALRYTFDRERYEAEIDRIPAKNTYRRGSEDV